MQTIASQLESAFRAAIQEAFGIDTDPIIAPSQNDKFGDYQSNAAMGLAKKLPQKLNPRAVAEQILAKLNLDGMVDEKPTIAGPGFINVRLSPVWLAKQLQAIAGDERLGVERVAKPTRVAIDYSAPNIAKEMHVGNIRSTIIGDAIARVLSFRGDDVIRQNHLGDWGTQFGRVVLAMWYEAAFERTGQHKVLDELMDRQQQKDPAALGQVVREIAAHHQRFINDDPDGTKYFLPFLQENKLTLAELGRAYAFVTAVTDHPDAKSIQLKHPTYGERTLADLPRLVTTFIQNPDEHEQERLAWEKARDVTLEACYDVYRQLNVQLADPSIQAEPLERGESFYNSMLPDVVKALRDKGLAVESDGAVVVQVPGYESPLIIQKAGGGYLYGTTDLAAVKYRTEKLHATRLLYFVDARQSQHFQQVFWTARQAGWMGNATADHAAFGTILGEDNKPFKARSGETVKLKELLDEAEERAAKIVAEKSTDLTDAQRKSVAHAVGIGAVKYADISKDRTSDYVFDWNKMLAFDGNTAPYLQNAYVRVHGIFRKARANGIDPTPRYETLKLETPQEQALAKHILRISDVIDAVARELKPHLLTNYLFDLASLYHAFFEHCPVLQSEDPLRSSRLALSALVARTLALGLDLIGIEHPEQM